MCAHRGGSQEGVENTLATFKKAEEIMDMIEMDVRLTKDGQVVVFHDDDFNRVAGVDKKVKDLDYAELPDYSKKYSIHFTTDGEYHAQEGDDHKVPLLEDVLKVID